MKKSNIKQIFSVILAVLFVLGGVSVSALAETPDQNVGTVKGTTSEVRGIWISFLEMQTMLQGKTEAEFTANISTAMENIKNFGLNTVYVQVRPYSDALYSSKYFPWSHIVTGTEGVNPGFDPLEIMIREAHQRGLKIEAWINPYRIRPEGNTKGLSMDNPARKWIEAGDRAVVRTGTMISYNPASTKAQNLIVAGVLEIVENYDVDGIHIDDYFYPVTGTEFDQTFDAKEYRAYQATGGTLSHGDWRRQNVEQLLRKIYVGIKNTKPNVRFGISPQSSVSNNYNVQYLDVAKIAATPGYCDYLLPQIYFGFQNEVQPYAKTLDEWNNMVTGEGIDLYVGLGSYKVGTLDSYAGAGKHEWENSTNVLRSMVEYGRTKSKYRGFALYRYDQLFKPETALKEHVAKERGNLKSIL